MQWVLALVLLAGCLQPPQLQPCGDNFCLEGTTCVADTVCATADQISACDGLADRAMCSVNGGVGICDLGVCVPTGCGNEIVDPDEECDDGNTTSGDGCRADCRKKEECGDAVVDEGEDCDDGNSNAADGCDACDATEWRATTLIGGSANATAMDLASPSGVAVDLNGNFYVADQQNHRILRVDATGVSTTVAGTGSAGYSGDGSAATSAQLAGPSSVALDGLGNVYIADTVNHRVRRVDAAGIITTVAGTGTQGFGGDGGQATSAQLGTIWGVAVDGLGNVYVTDSDRVRRIDATGIITTFAGDGTFPVGADVGDGGPATSAQLGGPKGVAVDGAGNVFIADTSGARIRRVDMTGIITTVAGSGDYGFAGDGMLAINAQLKVPHAIAIDAIGNLYIADTMNDRVRRVDLGGIITTVAGTGLFGGSSGDGGPATMAQLTAPGGVAVDGAGRVYITDSVNDRVRRIDTSGIISTVAGGGMPGPLGGAATSAPLSAPLSVAADGLGNFYVADQNEHRVRRIDAMGVITTVAGTAVGGFSGDGGPATSAQLQGPQGVAIGSLGLYIVDTGNHRIRRVDANGVITTIAGSGGGNGQFRDDDGGPATSAQLNLPSDVAIDGIGNVYIADTFNQRIRRVDTNGVITTIAGSGPGGTGGGGFGGDGGPGTGAQLNSPYGVGVDGLGNVYIADTFNHRVRRVDAAGTITTVAGTTLGFSGDGFPATGAQLASPHDVAVDAVGNLYIADFVNHRVRRVYATTGVITTVVGTDAPGDSGDGGAATSAQLNFPTSVAVDSLGALYVADSTNLRIRRVDPSGSITTAAGSVEPVGMGPRAQARLADPRALVLTAPFALVAGGSSGTVQASRATPATVEAVVGRYPHTTATGALARFRDRSFGTVSGLAHDPGSGVLYLTESSSNRLHVVTIVDPADENTWTIANLANANGIAGFADGAALAARFRTPTGLYFDVATRQLYVADTGNHVIRVIDLSAGIASAMVRTIAGTPVTLGMYGDNGVATAALLYRPQAITRCANGDLFIADTGNHRVRRVAAGPNTITTVLGDGVAASSGEGRPASTFPVHAPLGLACDDVGNLFVTSTTTVRLVPANASGVVDGTGGVQTIYGAAPRAFPASVTTCLTGLAVVDATKIQVVDSCTGLLVELRREPAN